MEVKHVAKNFNAQQYFILYELYPLSGMKGTARLPSDTDIPTQIPEHNTVPQKNKKYYKESK